MMLEEVLSRVFHPLRPGPDAPLIYTATLNGTRFAVQWTYYIGPTPEGLHEFLFLLELDPAAIGQGGSPIRQRIRLVCDEALRPVRYHTQTAGVVLGLDFAGDEV